MHLVHRDREVEQIFRLQDRSLRLQHQLKAQMRMAPISAALELPQ